MIQFTVRKLMKQVCFNVKSSRLIVIDGRLKVIQMTKKDTIELEMYYLPPVKF